MKSILQSVVSCSNWWNIAQCYTSLLGRHFYQRGGISSCAGVRSLVPAAVCTFPFLINENCFVYHDWLNTSDWIKSEKRSRILSWPRAPTPFTLLCVCVYMHIIHLYIHSAVATPASILMLIILCRCHFLLVKSVKSQVYEPQSHWARERESHSRMKQYFAVYIVQRRGTKVGRTMNI